MLQVFEAVHLKFRHSAWNFTPGRTSAPKAKNKLWALWQCSIQFILPAHGASHIINISINPLLTSLSFCSLPLNLNATPPHYHSPKPTEGSRNGTMKRAITRVQFWIVLYYMWVQFIVDYLLTPRVFLQVLWFLPFTDKTNMSKFQFYRWPTWKPPKGDVVSSLNISFSCLFITTRIVELNFKSDYL